jgi:hypothetical protein
MGLAAWLNLEGKDIAAFMFASLLGYLAGTFVPAGGWAVYASILVSYHAFLAWLVITADDEVGISLSPVSTIATHLACLTVILPLGMGRHFIPFFGLFRYGIAALAIFERGWLFTKNNNAPKDKDKETATTTPVVTSTNDDYQEWLRHLAEQKPASRKIGGSLKSEYEQWLLTRAQNRPVEPSNDGHTGGR